MSVAVIPARVTRQQVEAAWAVYQPLAAAIADTPSLAADITYMEQVARACDAWRSLFLAWDCTDAE